MCTHTHTHTFTFEPLSARTRVYPRVYALVQDIFALARSSAATTKNLPILRLCSPLASTLDPTRVPLPFPVIPLFLDRTPRLNLPGVARRAFCQPVPSDFPGKSTPVRSIPLPIITYLAANYTSFFPPPVFLPSRLSFLFSRLCVRLDGSLASINRSWRVGNLGYFVWYRLKYSNESTAISRAASHFYTALERERG